jgi:hypothetical protein
MTASLGDKFAEAAIIRQRFESMCEPVHITKVRTDDLFCHLSAQLNVLGMNL